MKKNNEYDEALRLLKKLHNDFPKYSIGRHISTAMSDYGDFWGITDKEFVFALNKYSAELELDEAHTVSDDYVKQIQEDAENLFNSTDEYDEEI